jgi:hypothetical protein
MAAANPVIKVAKVAKDLMAVARDLAAKDLITK